VTGDGDDPVELERAGWQALSAGGDVATSFYGEVLAGRVLFLLPGGMVVDDRSKVIESMSGTPWDRFDLTDERVVELGRDAAVVAYRATAWRGGQEYVALIASTYVREDGRWRLAVHQQTPL
jgi:hypothetical protein